MGISSSNFDSHPLPTISKSYGEKRCSGACKRPPNHTIFTANTHHILFQSIPGFKLIRHDNFCEFLNTHVKLVCCACIVVFCSLGRDQITSGKRVTAGQVLLEYIHSSIAYVFSILLTISEHRLKTKTWTRQYTRQCTSASPKLATARCLSSYVVASLS